MYLSSLDEVGKQRPLDVSWKAFELRPRERPVSPEEEAMKEAMIAQGWPHVERMAREVYGLEMKRGPNVDTRLAHVGLVVARGFGKEHEFKRHAFEAYWQDGQDIGQRDVLTQIAASLDIPEEKFAKALDDESYLDTVMEDQARARELGLRGVPATLVEGRFVLSGCQPPDQLQTVLHRIEAEGGIG